MVTMASNSKKVTVKNLAPESDISEDDLILCLESKKCCPLGGDVAEVIFSNDRTSAIITFQQEQVAQRVIGTQFTFCGTIMNIKKFQKPPTPLPPPKTVKLAQKPEEVKPDAVPPVPHPRSLPPKPHLLLASDGRAGMVSAALPTSSGDGQFSVSSETLIDTVQDKPGPLHCLPKDPVTKNLEPDFPLWPPPKPQVNIAIRANTDIQEVNNVSPAEMSFTNSQPTPSETCRLADACPEIKPILVRDTHCGAAPKDAHQCKVYPTQVDEVTAFPVRRLSFTEIHHRLLLSDDRPAINRSGSTDCLLPGRAGTNGRPVPKPRPRTQKFSDAAYLSSNCQDSNLNVEKPSRSSETPKIVKKDLPLANVSDEKLSLLRKLALENKVKCSCKIEVDVKGKTVTFTGSTDDVSSSEVTVMQSLTEYSSSNIDISSRTLVNLLQSKRGEKWLNDWLTEYNLLAEFHLKEDQICIMAVDDMTVTCAKPVLEQDLMTDTVPFQDHHAEFLRSTAWTDYVRKMESDSFIKVTLDDGQKLIVIDGSAELVHSTRSSIANMLKVNCKVVKKIRVKIGVFRLLTTHHLAEFQQKMKESMKQGQGRQPVDITFNTRTMCIELTGLADDVKVAEDWIDNFIKSAVGYDQLNVSEPGITCSDFTTPATMGHMTIVYLETSLKCTIEVRSTPNRSSSSKSDGGSDGSAAQSATAQKSHQVSAAAAVQSEIIVEQGELAQFVKADVLVNLIAGKVPDLSKAGAVAKSFLTAAGQQLQNDLAKQWPTEFGLDVVSTSAYGKVHAKKIYHAAVGKCRDVKSYKLMDDMISKCLEMAEKERMTSIAFPTVGCGNLLYKPKLVAERFRRVLETTGSKLTIYVVAYEEKTCRIFRECFSTSTDDGTASDSSAPDTHNQNSSSIEIHRGSLVDFKADVLVNLIGDGTQNLSKASRISACFLKKVGPQLQKDFAIQPVPTVFGKDVAVTPAHNLKATRIYHAAVRQYADANSVKLLYNMISTCLKMAENDKLSSIAFPTVGCGHLGFKADDVADSFTRAYADTGSKLKVYIIAYEQDLFQVFSSKFGSTSKKEPLPKSCEKHTLSDSQVTFHINTLEKPVLPAIKKALEDLAPKLSADTETIHNPVIGKLNPECEKQIKDLNVDAVRVEIEKVKKCIKIRAKNAALQKCKGEVNAILEKQSILLKSPEYIKRCNGPKDYLAFLAHEGQIRYPPYWTTADPTSSTVVKYSALDAKSELYKEVEKIVSSTWENRVGVGYDSAGLNHSKIVIQRIFVVENATRFQLYDTRRKQMCLTALQTQYPATSGLNGEKEIMTRLVVAGLKILPTTVVDEINEVFLLHGTNEDNVNAIMNNGLDERLGGDHLLFGKGSYFAETPTKADQYADLTLDTNHRPSTVRRPLGTKHYMCMARVLLGNPFVCSTAQKFKRPPCSKAGCKSSDLCKTHHTFYDSVIGTHKQPVKRLQFREFIVYDKCQSYLDFLIEYIRQ